MTAIIKRTGIRSRYKKRIKNNILFIALLTLAAGATLILALRPEFRNLIITSVPEDKTQLTGIDISNHQGNISWKEIDQNEVNFAFIKATEGTTFTDKSFDKNWEESHDAGFLRGAYHYFNIESDGGEQAEHFISVVPKENNTLPPVIDIEELGDNQARMIVELRQFATEIEKHYDVKPIFYVNKLTYENYVRDHFKDYIIWYAVYNASPPIDEWTFWQYTDKGSVKGIDGAVDMNKFKGSKEDIMKIVR